MWPLPPHLKQVLRSPSGQSRDVWPLWERKFSWTNYWDNWEPFRERRLVGEYQPCCNGSTGLAPHSPWQGGQSCSTWSTWTPPLCSPWQSAHACDTSDTSGCALRGHLGLWHSPGRSGQPCCRGNTPVWLCAAVLCCGEPLSLELGLHLLAKHLCEFQPMWGNHAQSDQIHCSDSTQRLTLQKHLEDHCVGTWPAEQHELRALNPSDVALKNTCSRQGGTEICSQAHLCMGSCEVFDPDHWIQSFEMFGKTLKVFQKESIKMYLVPRGSNSDPPETFRPLARPSWRYLTSSTGLI